MKNTLAKTPAAESMSDRLAIARIDRVVCTSTPFSESRKVRKSDAFAKDAHSQREMLFVLEGRSAYLYREAVWTLEPGTAVFIEPWEQHALGYQPGDSGLAHLWLHFRPGAISGACIGVEGGRMRALENFGALAGTPGAYLERRWAEAARESDAAVRASILRHVGETAMLELALGRKSVGATADPAKETADFLDEYIAQQHGRDCSLARLERLTGYSRFHLSRLFRSQRGITIGQAINESRRRFLEDASARGLKQRSIAEALGFSSASAYCLWKRRNLG